MQVERDQYMLITNERYGIRVIGFYNSYAAAYADMKKDVGQFVDLSDDEYDNDHSTYDLDDDTAWVEFDDNYIACWRIISVGIQNNRVVINN